MICPCGGECRSHEVKEGTVVTCNACGRRETFKRRAVAEGETPDLPGLVRWIPLEEARERWPKT